MKRIQKNILISLVLVFCILLFIAVKNRETKNRIIESSKDKVLKKSFNSEVEKKNKNKRDDLLFSESESEVTEEYRRVVLSELEKYQMSGSLLIVKDNQVVYNRASGFADAGKKIKNTPESEYMLASAQKSITAVAIMMLVDSGKLSLEQSLIDFYPEVPGAKDITVRDLLDMTSGLKMKPITREATSEEGSLKEIIDGLIPSGYNQSWHYVSENYSLLAGIITKVSGKTFKEFVTKNVIRPLDLKHTGFYGEFNKSENATENYKNDGIDLYKDKVTITDAYYSGELGAGGIYSSTGDFYQFCKKLLTGALINPDSRDILFANTPQPYQYTYAGGLYNREGYKMSHGILRGYESKLLITTDASTAVILLNNSKNNSSLNEQIARDLFDIVTDFKLNVD